MVQLVVQTQGGGGFEEGVEVMPSVGDSVGGGIVFKVVGTTVYVSSEVDLGTYQWGCSGVGISGADGTAIGTGEQNTLDIVAGCADTDSAAYMCDTATINGYSDWCLPSKDELLEMYTNKVSIGGFSNNWYWSSSEGFTNTSWFVYFGNGNTGYGTKSSPYKVRPIRVYTQESSNTLGSSRFLDLSDTSIKATYSSKEIQDVTQQKSDFTHNITLPFTQVNNDFFAHYYEVNVDGSFRADVKASCSIYVDSNLIFDGYIQLVKVDTLNENYTAICFGDVANLATELGEDKLNDLDLTKYNHILSQANIENSWNGLTDYVGALADGDEILYPIIDNGLNYNGNTLNTNAGAIKPRDLKPSIKVKTLLDEIVNKAGYTISSTFLNSTFFTSQYMTLGGDLEGSATSLLDGFKVGMTADQNAVAGVAIDFDNETSGSGYYDANGNFNTTTNAYTVPHNGVYGFQLQVVIDTTIASTGSASVLFYVNGVIHIDVVPVSFGSNTVGLDVFTGSTSSISLSAGDVVTFRVYSFSSFGTKVIKKFDTINGTVYDSFVKLVSIPEVVEGGTVGFEVGNNLLPKDKQIDFVKSIFARYNLIVEVDKETPKQLNIEPIQDFRDVGTSKDWTDKLDLSKSVIIESTNRFRKAELNLTDKEDADRINDYWQNEKGFIYNSFKFPFYGDFGSGELKVPTIFSSFAPKKVDNNLMFIAQHFDFNDGVAEGVKVKPKLFYYSGKKQLPPSSNYKLLNEATGVYTTKVEYPFCNHYSMAGDLVTETDTDIRFKAGNILNQSSLVETQTGNDVYNGYWKRYLSNIYNKDARIQIAYFYLTSQDIADFKYNDKVFIKDSYWLINKIDSFAIGVDNSTKVELIKILEAPNVELCSLTVTSYNLNGTTNWIDSDGASATPTASCCEEEGLTMVGNKCIWNNLTTNELTDPPVLYEGDNNETVLIGQYVADIKTGNTTTETEFNGVIKKVGEGDPKEGDALSWDDTLNQTEWRALPPNLALGVTTSRIYIKPDQFKTWSSDSIQSYSRDTLGSVQPSAYSTRTKVYASTFVPAGYKVTGFEVFSSQNRSIQALSSRISNDSIGSLGTGTANTFQLITAWNSVDGDYFILTYEIGASTDEIYGAELHIESI